LSGARFFSGLLITLGFIIFIIGVLWGWDDINTVNNAGIDSSIQTIQGYIILAAGIVSGLIVIGFGFVIGLLNKIADNTSNDEKIPPVNTASKWFNNL